LTRIQDRFAEALRSRVDAGCRRQLAQSLNDVSPLRARQLEVPPELVAKAAAECLGLEYAESLSDVPVSGQFVSAVPISFARRHGLVGLAGRNGEIALAMCDLAQWPQLQALAKIMATPIRPLFAPREEILRTINAAYQQQSGAAERVIEQLDGREVMAELREVSGREDLLDVASRAPVIKLVNLMLFEAVKRRASDVHVQPHEDSLVVRLRIDGVLFDVYRPPRSLQQEIISRIKVMGGMNIAERRLAQDGRATVEVGDRVVDLRIATLPTSFGERAVIRLLDKSARLYQLDQLGMPPEVLTPFGGLIRRDHGIILVTGPTGSGKSTTLYAALQEIDSAQMNVLTVEDPIEYQLEGISQTQVNERKGMTFAGALRHVLRQDPDIIMLGEIRDRETARMAIQSALTGHLVFSTLHTNDAPGAVARLLDLDLEPYLVASSLLAVLAQRLVRRICTKCRRAYEPSAAELRKWGLDGEDIPGGRLYRGEGCEQCMDTGYRERVGIFELLTATESVRELILTRARASSIRAAALAEGMGGLRADGIAKATAGVTTMEEVARVTGGEEF